MADHGSGTRYLVTVDHAAGLEPVPPSELESMLPSYGQPQNVHHWEQQQRYGQQQHGQQQQHHDQQTYTPGGYTTETSQEVYAPEKDEPRRRILGLSVRAFWVALFILVVILAAGIGGGIAGGMAAQRAAAGASPATTDEAEIPSPVSSSSEGPTTEPTPTTTTPSSTTSSPTNPTTSPAPTDAGCPDINGTAYTPLNATGQAIVLKSSGQAQSFRRLCGTNYPSGAGYGNPGIHDILKLWLPSLEDCIAACAAYNLNYEVNVAAGAYGNGNGGGGGLCRSVAVVKREGEYCYLKNGTGKDNTFGKPKDYSSGVLMLDD